MEQENLVRLVDVVMFGSWWSALMLKGGCDYYTYVCIVVIKSHLNNRTLHTKSTATKGLKLNI